MKKLYTFALAVLLGCTVSVYAQAPQPIQEVQHNPSGCNVIWDSVNGRTYFIQMSLGLQNWTFFNPIISGDGTPKGYAFSCSDGRMFLRLWYTDIPTSNPADHDFDGDGIGSAAELAATPQTNPLRFDSDGDGTRDGGEDSDGNGLGDGWEIAHFGSIGQSATADPDNDGLSNLDEYNFATDPNVDSQFKDSSSLVYQYDLGKLKSSQANGIQSLVFSYSPSGNILTVTTSN